MPLVSMRQLLDHAAENNYGLPAFNVNNMEQVWAIMEAANQIDAPVIMQASAGARKYAGVALHASGRRFPVTVGVTAVDMEGKQFFVCLVRLETDGSRHVPGRHHFLDPAHHEIDDRPLQATQFFAHRGHHHMLDGAGGRLTDGIELDRPVRLQADIPR